MTDLTGSAVGWDIDPIVAAWRPLPALEEDITADVCVVGLGGSGLAAVGEALDRGLSVVGLDAGRVGAGAAGRNGGILTPTPGIGYRRAAAAWGMAQLAAFHSAAMAEIDALAACLGPGVVRRTGAIRLLDARWSSGGPGVAAGDPEAEWSDAVEQRHVLGALGVEVADYDGPLGRGLYLPHEASMNPARRVVELATASRTRARLHENSPVTAIHGAAGGTGSLVRTSAGSVAAGVVLVAVDGGLGRILPELADRVTTVRLQMLATAPVEPGLLPCPVHLRRGFDYAQQDPAGRILIGGGRDLSLPTEFTDSDEPTPVIQDWIEAQAAGLAGVPVTVTHRWGASAGYTADGLPVVASPMPGVLACGGYCGTGNIVGVLAAKAALRWVLDGERPPVWFTSVR